MLFLTDGNNKIPRGGKSAYQNLDAFRTIEIGEVLSVYDKDNLGRIKVRIKGPKSRGGDDNTPDSELPWCFPMIPKFMTSQPKVGEAVFVFVFGKDKALIDRMYIGPIISQPQQLKQDPFYNSALAGFSFSTETPAKSTNDIPQLKGVFPNPQDVSIQGRYNTDITQKENEIVIRAGKFETSKPDSNNPFPFKFNFNTQGFIQIKNDFAIPYQDSSFNGTVTTVMANKINLISHNGSPKFNLNQENLISDEEMKRILDEAHQLPYGDVLLEYLILMKQALFFHVHNGNGNPSSGVPLVQFREKAEALEKAMLSKNIRIN